MTQIGPQIRIKGAREGLRITLETGDFTAGVQQLEAELAPRRDFLQGSRIILEVGERPLTRAQLAQLRELLAAYNLELWAVLADSAATKEAARELGLATRLPGSQTDLNGKALPANGTAVDPIDAAPEMAAALLLRETLRSGRAVHHAGPVVVLGDVNPGAEIIAAGDVIVWGRLRGLVHAGALGDATAVICALELTPTQLRIADQIAVSPGERPLRPAPEVAAIRDGQIVAQPWHAR